MAADKETNDGVDNPNPVCVKLEVGENDEEENPHHKDYVCPYPSAYSQNDYTMRATRTSVRIFRDYCQETKGRTDFENFAVSELSTLLEEFYQNVKRKDGSLYSLSSVQAIRAGIGRHLLREKQIDIFHGPPFYNTNNKFRAHCKYLRSIGLAKVKGIPVMKLHDLQKLYSSETLDENTPWGLQRKVFVDLLLFANVNVTRNSLRNMNKDFLSFGEDSSGMEYVCIYNNPTHNLEEKVTLYSIPGFARCPVHTFKKYVSKLHPDYQTFWQRPLSTVHADDAGTYATWYSPSPVGHNSLGGYMGTISQDAHLSQTYTNSSIRLAMAEADMKGSEFAEYLFLSGMLGNVELQEVPGIGERLERPGTGKRHRLDRTRARTVVLRSLRGQPPQEGTVHSQAIIPVVSTGTCILAPSDSILTNTAPSNTSAQLRTLLPASTQGGVVPPNNTTLTIIHPGKTPSALSPSSAQSSIIIQTQQDTRPSGCQQSTPAKPPNQVFLMPANQYTVQLNSGGKLFVNPAQTKAPVMNSPAVLGSAKQPAVTLGCASGSNTAGNATSEVTTPSPSTAKIGPEQVESATTSSVCNWVVGADNAIIPEPTKEKTPKLVERESQTDAVPCSNKEIQVEIDIKTANDEGSPSRTSKALTWLQNECVLCGIIFKNDLVFAMHKALHGSQGDFQCNVCKKIFNNTVEFNGHTYSSHQ